MEHRARLIEYWQRCLEYQACANLTSLDHRTRLQEIAPLAESSPISPTDLKQFEVWFQAKKNTSSTFFYIPEFGQNSDTGEIIFPYVCFVELNDAYEIKPLKAFPYPIFGQRWLYGETREPRCFLEASKLVEYYQLQPIKKRGLSCIAQHQYIKHLQSALIGFDWRAQWLEDGYPMQTNGLIGCVQELPTWVNEYSNPKAAHKQTKPLLTRVYRDQCLHAETDWIEDNQFKYATAPKVHLSHQWSLSQAQRACLNQALAMEPGQWLSMQAGYQSGQTTVFQTLIAELWLQAALNGENPPHVIYFDGQKKPKPWSIFHLPEHEDPLPLQDCVALCTPGRQSGGDASGGIHALLSNLDKQFGIQVNNLNDCKKSLLQHLKITVAKLNDIHKLAYSYWEIKQHIELNYDKEGGISQKLMDAEKNLAMHRAHVRHLQVLQSLWARQTNQQSSLLKAIGLHPVVQKRQLKRLKQLFAEHLPEEDVQDLSLQQMEKRIEALLMRSQQCGRSLEDNVFQMKTDLRQLEIAEKRFFQVVSLVCPSAHLDALSMEELQNHLDCQVRVIIFKLCKRYWQAELLLRGAWEKNAEFQKHVVSSADTSCFDWCLIEHAERFSIAELLLWMAKSKRAVSLGQPDHTNPRWIAESLDYHLLESVDEFINEADFEDLYYKGVLLSSHGHYLAQEYADIKSADCVLEQAWKQAKPLLDASHALGNSSIESMCTTSESAFLVEDVRGQTSMRDGHVINTQEAQTIVDWVAKHLSDNQCFKVVCSTYGQKWLIQSLLAECNFPSHHVDVLCDLQLEATEKVIFSPVFTLAERPPYLFNEQKGAMMRMLSQTQKQWIFIGDLRLLAPAQHAPIGIIAKRMGAQYKAATPKSATLEQTLA